MCERLVSLLPGIFISTQPDPEIPMNRAKERSGKVTARASFLGRGQHGSLPQMLFPPNMVNPEAHVLLSSSNVVLWSKELSTHCQQPEPHRSQRPLARLSREPGNRMAPSSTSAADSVCSPHWCQWYGEGGPPHQPSFPILTVTQPGYTTELKTWLTPILFSINFLKWKLSLRTILSLRTMACYRKSGNDFTQILKHYPSWHWFQKVLVNLKFSLFGGRSLGNLVFLEALSFYIAYGLLKHAHLYPHGHSKILWRSLKTRLF